MAPAYDGLGLRRHALAPGLRGAEQRGPLLLLQVRPELLPELVVAQVP